MQGDNRERPRAEFACEWICGVCAAVCPSLAIDYTPGKVTVDCECCTGCGECVRVCPCGVLKEDEFARP